MVNAPSYGFTSSSFLHSVQEVHPLCKMALGVFGSKRGNEARSNSSSSNDEKTGIESGGDPELGRIEKPSRRDVDDSSDASITVGKQMEMEAENAIKYRTCSWQKVCCGPNVLLRTFCANGATDCRTVVLRVHLSGNHVVPMVLLGSRPSPRSHIDRRDSFSGSLHVLDHLVRQS